MHSNVSSLRFLLAQALAQRQQAHSDNTIMPIFNGYNRSKHYSHL